jgi:RNA polymerase sigma factor (sigma-70 family)
VNGESAALGELYDALGGILFSLSFRILNDRWESEEVVQDVLSNLWRKPTAYSPQKGKLHSWLLTLVRNRSIDRYRSRSRRKDVVEIDEVILHTKPIVNHFEARNRALKALESIS